MVGGLLVKPFERDVDRTFDVFVLILLGRKHFNKHSCFFPD
jgi:hypothetical protein